MGRIEFAMIVNQKCIDKTLDANINEVIFEGHVFLPHIQCFCQSNLRIQSKANLIYIHWSLLVLLVQAEKENPSLFHLSCPV